MTGRAYKFLAYVKSSYRSRYTLRVPYEIYREFRHPALVTNDAENYILKSSLIS
jgi:hypothetical protein